MTISRALSASRVSGVLLVVLLVAALTPGRSLLGQTDRPIAVPDRYWVAPGQVLEVEAPGVLANDFAPAGATLQVALTIDGRDAVASSNIPVAFVIAADGSFSYQAADGFVGVDRFLYRAEADGVLSEPTIVIIEVSDTPMATPVVDASTPVPDDPSTTVLTPFDAACDVEPVDLRSRLEALIGQPAPDVVFPRDEPRPLGEPADAETVAEVEALVERYVACTNARRPLSVYALLSSNRLDQWLSQAMLGEADDPDLDDLVVSIERTALMSRFDAVEDPNAAFIVFEGLEDVVVLDDGRIAAVVLGQMDIFSWIAFRIAIPGASVVMYFVEEDGRLVIDDVLPFAG